jgi:DNA polymerase-1
VRTAEGRQVRSAFRPKSDDWTLICADYSQIELRVLAHFSGDRALCDAFREGLDIHAAVAADVFSVPLSQVTSEQRGIAKAVNFGVIYGQTPWGLAAALGIDKEAAAEFIDQYFRRYSGVAAFCEQVLEETAKSGYAQDAAKSSSGDFRNSPHHGTQPQHARTHSDQHGAAGNRGGSDQAGHAQRPATAG